MTGIGSIFAVATLGAALAAPVGLTAQEARVFRLGQTEIEMPVAVAEALAESTIRRLFALVPFPGERNVVLIDGFGCLNWGNGSRSPGWVVRPTDDGTPICPK